MYSSVLLENNYEFISLIERSQILHGDNYYVVQNS